MLIQALADAEDVADTAVARRFTELEALEIRLLTDRLQEQQKVGAFLSQAKERMRKIHLALKTAPPRRRCLAFQT